MSSHNATLFEKFEVIEVLKKDEHTGVYLAQHLFLGKKIILKTLSTKTLADTSVLERFKREAKLLAKLEHPNIIKVLDFGTYGDSFYISFEYFRSRNLRDVFSAKKPPEAEKRNLFIQLLKGVQVAHENQIIHRDLKPENILVDDNMHLKIADFGLALAENDPSITNKSSIVGTPGYMAPEQITGEKLDARSDLFSLGTVLFELYTGKNPFLRQDIGGTINAILTFNENIFDDTQQVPADMLSVLRLLLIRNREQRPSSCAEVLALLGEQVQPGGNAGGRNKLVNTFLYPAGAVLFILLGFLLYRFYAPSSANVPEGQQTEQSAVEQQVSLPPQQNQVKDGRTTIDTSAVLPQTMQRFIDARINIDCLPWAVVYIDSIRLDETPVNRNMRLALGKHRLKLMNPDYPVYSTTFEINESGTVNLRVKFDDVFATVVPQVFPWGAIIIDGTSYGVTPFDKPVYLLPGKHRVKISNTASGDVERTITVKSGEVFYLRHNFEEQTGRQN